MASVSERMKGIEPKILLDYCKKFLGKKWQDVTEDEFGITPITQGFFNRLFICEIKGASEKVLIRYYSGNIIQKNDEDRTNTEMTEVLTFYALGVKGFGPKLYGTFDGGRVEEFIPSRTMKVSELNEPEISQALARSLAKFHLMDDLPIQKKPQITVKTMRSLYKQFKETHPDLKKGGNHVLQHYIDFDMEGETEWIERTIPKIKTRVVFCHNDLNRSNVLIRNDPEGKLSWDQKLVPIDYEFSGYNYRGTDIGNHFCMRRFDFGAEKFMTGLPYPNDEQRRVFVTAYAEYLKDHNNYDDYDPSGLDSVEHILMETEFGTLMCRIGNIAWCLKGLNFWAERMEKKLKERDPNEPKDDNFADFYRERKREFLERYPQYA